MNQVTQILNQIRRGESGAAEELLPLVYRELRRLAGARLVHERPDGKHDATSLVHEAYLRLVGDGAQQWENRGHFFAAAAEAMRRILVENARRRRRLKHGGNLKRVELDHEATAETLPADDLLALDEALTRFASLEPDKARVVELRYFAGLSVEQCASAMGISTPTVKRHWAYARAWLFSALNDEPEH